MKNEAQSCHMSGGLPPPPPPLPLPKTPKLVSPRVSSLNSVPYSKLIRSCFGDNYKSIVSYCKPVKPVLQDGPQCGIVALAMASQLLSEKHCTVSENHCLVDDNHCSVVKDFTVDEILTDAKRLGYTKSGEMFSAQNMANLAESVIGCKATVLADLSTHKREILSCICNGYPVLFPYDADKNHEPCLNKGKNAHWAVLNGVVIALSEDLSTSDFKCLDGESDIFELPSGKKADRFIDNSVRTFVYSHQGKSRNVALWDFDTLLLSNKNMFEVTGKYSAEYMLVPNEEDALCELRDKAVLLERK